MKTAAITIITMLVVALVSAWVGYRYAMQDAQENLLVATQRAIAQANEQAKIDADILSAAAQKQADTQTKQRIIIKEVVRHVASRPDYSACKLDACGLCLAQSAARGEGGADCPCGADARLPAP